MANPEQTPSEPTPQQVPPEREFEYIQRAEALANEAAEPVIKGLADLAITQAEKEEPQEAVAQANNITLEAGRIAEHFDTVGDEAEAHAHENDYAIDESVDTGIAEEAEAYANKDYFKNRMGVDEATATLFAKHRAQLNDLTYEQLFNANKLKGFKVKNGVGSDDLTENEEALLEDGSKLDKPQEQ